MKKEIALLLLLGVTFENAARASSKNDAWMNGWAREITEIQAGLADGTAQGGARKEDNWQLRNFLVRARPRGGLEVPGFVKFEVIPEVELIFQRAWSEGTEPYHP